MKFILTINNSKFNEFKVAPRDIIVSSDLLTESIKLFFKYINHNSNIDKNNLSFNIN